jgi:hypothetical protein
VLTILSSDKGNDAVVLGTSAYSHKIGTILEDKAYKRLEMDPIDSIELGFS